MQSHEEVDENEDIDNQEYQESEENEEDQNESEEECGSDGAYNESQELEEQDGEEQEIEKDDIVDDSEDAQIEDTQEDQELTYEGDDDDEQNGEVILHYEDSCIDSESEALIVSHAITSRNREKKRRFTKTKKNFTLRQSLPSLTQNTGLSDGSKNSSTEDSGWDSHRSTRKTLRQTFGNDFTPRKSLRALVLEKSAKRQTIIDAANANLHQANSTELPVDESDHQDMQVDEDQIDDDEDAQDVEESAHEISRRTRQTTLEMHLQKIKKQNLERKLKIEERVRNSFQKPRPLSDVINFQIPPKLRRLNAKPQKTAKTAPKVKRTKSNFISLENLPPELIEDMKYKPPKRFKPRDASWITNRLYKFLENKLETSYDYEARIRAESLVEMIYNFVRDIRRDRVAPLYMVDELKKEMARLHIVKTHFDFYNFFQDYLPNEVANKVIPDIINDIPLPRDGVFSDIIVS